MIAKVAKTCLDTVTKPATTKTGTNVLDDVVDEITDQIAGQAVKGGSKTIDIPITGPNGNTVNVRTGWITKTGSDIPELTTIYVKD